MDFHAKCRSAVHNRQESLISKSMVNDDTHPLSSSRNADSQSQMSQGYPLLMHPIVVVSTFQLYENMKIMKEPYQMGACYYSRSIHYCFHTWVDPSSRISYVSNNSSTIRLKRAMLGKRTLIGPAELLSLTQWYISRRSCHWFDKRAIE
jgi:hypothetical protein